MEEDPQEEVQEQDNLGTGLHVMIITYDESTGYPKVELGDVSPYLAISMLQSVIEGLEYVIPTPQIQYKDRIILDPSYFSSDELPEFLEEEDE